MPPVLSPRDRLIVAFDTADSASALEHASRLADHIAVAKIGLELFTAAGPNIVRDFRTKFPQLQIFLDLKLHDIPNTMRGAIRAAKHLGVRWITVHAGSGIDHLRACVEEAGEDLGILAVTVLTSQDAVSCRQAGHTRSPSELVEIRAECAARSGCTGVVCSGHELVRIASICPDLFRIVPGIRPRAESQHDQKRVMNPTDAMANGATHLVVGRPILHASDPVSAANSIVEEIAVVLPS